MTSAVSPTGSASSILTSALQGAGTEAAVVAENVANAGSVNYKSQRAETVSTAPGMRVVVAPSTQDVDTTTQMVNLLGASTSYEAAAKALSSIDKTEKHVLDTLG